MTLKKYVILLIVEGCMDHHWTVRCGEHLHGVMTHFMLLGDLRFSAAKRLRSTPAFVSHPPAND